MRGGGRWISCEVGCRIPPAVFSFASVERRLQLPVGRQVCVLDVCDCCLTAFFSDETLDEIAELLDACGVPRLGEYGRAIGIYPGISPRDMIDDDRVDAERVREALEAFATAVGRADG